MSRDIERNPCGPALGDACAWGVRARMMPELRLGSVALLEDLRVHDRLDALIELEDLRDLGRGRCLMRLCAR